MFNEYSNFDAVGLAELIAGGEVSASEVLQAALERADKYNPTINAVVTDMYDEARAVADANPTGPFAGVPFLVKDIYNVKGIRCTKGSRLWADFIPDYDDEIVKRYRKAGLVIFGKSNTPEVELAPTTESVLLGACKNPWDLTRTTAGSSGGSAAAVAARILPVAQATDGGGSIRMPASCCGLVGLKPTRGRTPLGPDIAEGWGSQATGHVVSRTVRDSAIMLDVTHGPAKGDPYHAPHFDGSFFDAHQRDTGALKIGIDLRPANTNGTVSEECKLAVGKTAKLLESLGHNVEHLDLDYDREELTTATYILMSSSVANIVQSRHEELGFDDLSLDMIETATFNTAQHGKAWRGEDYARATNTIHKVGRFVESQFNTFDLILSPTLLQPPVPLGFMNTNDGDHERYVASVWQFWGPCHLYNASGHPAISLPLHWSQDNLPVGVQFAASMGNELLLLQLAQQLEQAQPWKDRKPPLID